jgi:hypothetical protein
VNGRYSVLQIYQCKDKAYVEVVLYKIIVRSDYFKCMPVIRTQNVHSTLINQGVCDCCISMFT